MISTYTNQITSDILNFFVRTNLVAILINDTSLGLTDTPTTLELYNRKSLTMDYIVTKELSLAGGYSRAICSIDSFNIEPEYNRSRLDVRALFTPTGVLNPATHIVYVTQANLNSADPIINGNNRGDNFGTVIKVAPLQYAPIQLAHPVPYTYLADITVSF